MSTTCSRWPKWVYGEGEEPDYRFSFADERTFLTWVRTGVAFVATGVALDVVEPSEAQSVQGMLAITLVLLGTGMLGSPGSAGLWPSAPYGAPALCPPSTSVACSPSVCSSAHCSW